MEHRSEPQVIVAPVVSATPSATPTFGSGVIFRRTIRLLLRRFVYLFVLLLRPLRRFALFAIVVAGLLGVIGWLSFQLWAPHAGTVPDTRAALVPPAASVENYIKGQQNYNAELMWDAFSPELQANQMSNGSSKATMQSQVNQLRQSGLQFNRFDYIGGEAGAEGIFYTYYVEVQVNNQHATMPMTFLVDKNGKVANVISSQRLSDMAQAAQ